MENKEKVVLGALVVLLVAAGIPALGMMSPCNRGQVEFSTSGAARASVIRDAIQRTVAEKDAYVDSDSPSTNYGGQEYFRVGDFLGLMEAYFYFNFSGKPANWTRAELAFYFYSVSATLNVSVYLVNETWDEYTINYANKPATDQLLGTLLVSSSGFYRVNVTSLVNASLSEQKNGLGVALVMEPFQDNVYATGYTREETLVLERRPAIEWTYPENATITVTYPSEGDNLRTAIHNITWTTTGNIQEVSIELWNASGLVENVTDLFGYTENDGEYTWFLDADEHDPASEYWIVITDHDDPNVFGVSGNFTIGRSSIPVDDNTGAIGGYEMLLPVTIFAVVVLAGGVLLARKRLPGRV